MRNPHILKIIMKGKKQTMKKILALILAIAMMLTLVACGQSSEKKDGDSKASLSEEAKNELARAEIRNAISLLFDRNYIVEAIGRSGSCLLLRGDGHDQPRRYSVL